MQLHPGIIQYKGKHFGLLLSCACGFFICSQQVVPWSTAVEFLVGEFIYFKFEDYKQDLTVHALFWLRVFLSNFPSLHQVLLEIGTKIIFSKNIDKHLIQTADTDLISI